MLKCSIDIVEARNRQRLRLQNVREEAQALLQNPTENKEDTKFDGSGYGATVLANKTSSILLEEPESEDAYSKVPNLGLESTNNQQ